MHPHELAILAGRAFETGFCTKMVMDYAPASSILEELAEAESMPDVPRLRGTSIRLTPKENPSLLHIVRRIGEVYGTMEKALIGIDGVRNPPAVSGYGDNEGGQGIGGPAGSWQHADLLFLKDDGLYVYELTVSGGLPTLLGFFSEKRTIDFRFQAAASQLNIGVASEAPDFPSVCLKLIESAKRILPTFRNVPVALEILLPETAKLFQAMAYAASFLKDHRLHLERIKRVIVTVLHPVLEVQRIIAPMDKPSVATLSRIASEFQSLYITARDGRHASRGLGFSPESLKNMLRQGREELGRVADDPMVITPSFSIDELRSRTKDFLERAVSAPERLFFMGSCPGSGKTTAIREGMLPELSARAKESCRKVTVFYFSPRRALNESLTAGLAPQGFRSSSEDGGPKPFDFLDFKVLPIDVNAGAEPGFRRGADNTVISTVRKRGNIQETVKLLQSLFPRQNHLVIITTQSITQLPTGGRNTSDYLIDYMRANPKRAFWIVFDEILGSEGAVHAILRIVREAPENCRIVALDATAPSGRAFKILIEQAAGNAAVPPHLVRLKNDASRPWTEEAMTLDIGRNESVQARCAWGYSFPAEKLTVKMAFVRDTDDDDRNSRTRIVVDHAVRLIGDRMQDPSQVFIYIQDRNLVESVRKGIEERIPSLSGKVESFTSHTRVADANERCRRAKVVVSTSTTSRGVDTTPRGTRCLVVFPSFNEEEELAELPQVIGRMRGDPEFERRPKDVEILFFSRSKKALAEQQSLRKRLYLEMLERDRLLEASPAVNAALRKDVRQAAALTTAILETLHKAGLARLARETVRSVVAPGEEILFPVRLLHLSVVNSGLLTQITGAARTIQDQHEKIGFQSFHQAMALKESVLKHLGLLIGVPRKTLEEALEGRVPNADAKGGVCVHYPFLLFQVPLGQTVWLGGTESRDIRRFAASLQKVEGLEDIRPDRNVSAVLRYLTEVRGDGVNSGMECIAVYLPWFILCQEYPEAAGQLVGFHNLSEITRYRLPLLTAGCGDLSFNGREIVGFCLANPMAHRILGNAGRVVKLPIDLV